MQTHNMIRSTSLLSVAFCGFNGLVSASPLIPRQSSSCTELNAAFDSSCYESLNLGDFLTNQTHGWNATRGGTCVSGDNAAYCCRDTDPSWSACFIRQAVELAARPSCDSTNNTNCPTSSFTIVPEVASANQRKYQYVLQNIYSIYTLFTSWQSTLTQGITSQTNIDLHDLVTEKDPDGIVSLSEPDVVQAYLLGLPLLGTSNASRLVTQQVLSQVSAPAQALLHGLQHAPAVAQALFVNSSATSYPVETTGVEEYLATNTTIAVLTRFINNGLVLIMGDLPTFVAFTSSGLFSGAGNLTIQSDEGLDAALQAIITSEVQDDANYQNLVNGLDLGIKIP